MLEKFRGTAAALVTPFDQKGNIDFDALKRLLEHTSPHLDYYVVNGTTAESPSLSFEEQLSVLDFVKDFNKSAKPIVFGLGGNNTKEVIAKMQQMNVQGIDAFLSVSPYYNKPTQEGMYQHFMALADASPLPLFLYNVPPRTGSNMSAKTTLRLAQHSNIIAIKEAAGDLVQCTEIAKNKPNDFLLISGDDLITIPMISIGAVGVISVIANGLPKIFCDSINFALNGNYAKANTLFHQYLEVNKLIFEEGNPAGVKSVLASQNVIKDHVRLPLVSVSDDLKERIKAEVEQI